MKGGRDYTNWTRERLIKRIKVLEDELSEARGSANTGASPSGPDPGLPPNVPPKRKEKERKKLDPSKYSTRFIALKLAYLGKNYNGFEHQTSATVPTIEAELWRALVKSCLIFPEAPDLVDWNAWEYSKCGRTDKGVSAFGQVIGIRVRSNRPVEKPAAATEVEGTTDDHEAGPHGENADPDSIRRPFDPIADEIPYCRILNRLLPPDIRALAWCPNPPDGFSARFSCRERQYRYFFTQPAYPPLPQDLELAPGPARVKDGWLDIGAMREAAKLFEGLHDFRNFCKVDPNKQITNFVRRIFESDIVEVPDVHSVLPYLSAPDLQPGTLQTQAATHPRVYSFNVRGSAFLWHQIRHMVAILFAVGQGLEAPSIVSELLDVDKHPRKPGYAMAEEVPLVLWDCVFPEEDDPGRRDALDWIWLGEDSVLNLHGSMGLLDHLWQHWREKKMDELLANRLLDWASSQPDVTRRLVPSSARQTASQKLFEGGDSGRHAGIYVPVLQKPLLPSPEEVNNKWARRKGFANSEEMRSTGNWRSAIKAAQSGAEEITEG